jgi:hypothetical protein
MERVEALTREVMQLRQQIAPDRGPSLTDRIDGLTGELHRRTAWWRAAVAIGVVLVLGVTSGVFLLEVRTRAEIADANKKLCPLVALLIPDTGGREPTTEYGRRLAEQARLLYVAYGCQGRSPNA